MRSTKLRFLTVVAAASLAFGVTACSGDSDSPSAGDSQGSFVPPEVQPDGDFNETSREQVQDGGELVLAVSELSQQQNPFHSDSTQFSKDVWKWYNPQLLLLDNNGEARPNPSYVSNISAEDVNGKTVVTYDIVEEAQFNDGTPIDWTSFENTWRFNSGVVGNAPAAADGYELIESVTQGESEKQAVVTFRQAYPWWGALFAYVLPPQVNSVDAFNTSYLSALQPEWGAGPYKVETVDLQAGTVSFVRNEDWWGEPGKLDKVTIRQLDPQASLGAFQSGEIDATGVSTIERYNVVKEMGEAAEIRAAKAPSTYVMVLNSAAPLLQEAAVREAILTGVDRSALADIRFAGLDYSEELPGSLILFDNQNGYEDNFDATVSFDPAEAQTLLEEAGWFEGADGVRERYGQRLSLRYVVTGETAVAKETAEAMKTMLADIGIELTVEELPSAEFSSIVTNKTFDILPMGFASSDPFGAAYIKHIYGSGSSLNASGISSPELDAGIAQLSTIEDPDEYIAQANELEQDALANFSLMPYANGPDFVAVKPGLANYGAYSFATVPVENIGWVAE